MKITVLLGSPRKQNTNAMVEAFIKGAQKNHEVELLHVGRMNIKPCLGCGYCQRDNHSGTCVQKDDMQKVYEAWSNSDMVVFASAIYFWNFTGQMQSTISRLFSQMGCKSPDKYALLLNSEDDDVYEAAIYAYKNTIDLFEGKDLGIFTMQGNKPENRLKEIEEFGQKI